MLKWFPIIISIVAIVISTSVATYGILQQDFFQEVRHERARATSTAAILNNFFTSRSYQGLSHLSDNIETHTVMKRFDPDADLHIARSFVELTRENGSEVRVWIIRFVRTLDFIYYCGWVNDGKSNTSCDKDLLFQVYFEEISWIFFNTRYGIYCDDTVREIFAHHGFDRDTSQVYHLETMLLEYLNHSVHVRMHKDPDTALVSRTHEDGNYHVLRPNLEEFCRSAQQDNAS